MFKIRHKKGVSLRSANFITIHLFVRHSANILFVHFRTFPYYFIINTETSLSTHCLHFLCSFSSILPNLCYHFDSSVFTINLLSHMSPSNISYSFSKNKELLLFQSALIMYKTTKHTQQHLSIKSPFFYTKSFKWY